MRERKLFIKTKIKYPVYHIEICVNVHMIHKAIICDISNIQVGRELLKKKKGIFNATEVKLGSI